MLVPHWLIQMVVLSIDTALTQIGKQRKADLLGEFLSDGRLTSSREC